MALWCQPTLAHPAACDHPRPSQAHKQAADAIMAAEAREVPTVLVANNVLWFEADPERSVNVGLLNPPLTTYRVLLTTRYSPLTTHHSPLTTRYSPLTTHHSPLTTHHSPPTTG